MKKISEELRKAFVLFRKGPPKIFGYLDSLTSNDMSVFMVMHSFLKQNPDENFVGVSEIGKRLHMSKPALTQAINRLEDKGLVERVLCKNDRRATFVAFTEEGDRIFKKEKLRVDSFMDSIVERMGEGDVEQLIFLLNKFKRVASEIGKEYLEKEKGN